MRRGWLAVVPVLIVGLATPAGPAEPVAQDVVMVVRMLQLEQDRLVAGEARALERLDDLMLAAAKAIDSSREDESTISASGEAVLTYGLSGGDASVLGRFGDTLPDDDPLAPLINGAAAWRRGDIAKASEFLASADPLALRPEVGAALALVQSALTSDPAQSLRHLRIARLLAPGTLVEEAALRRGLQLLSEHDPGKEFVHDARRYAARFSRSPYAAGFPRLVARAATHPSSSIASEDIADIVDRLPADHRQGIWLEIGREAAISGNAVMASAALDRLRDAAASMRTIEASMHLYMAMSRIASGEVSGELRTLDDAMLDERDGPLLAAARALVDETVPALGPARPDGQSPEPQAEDLRSIDQAIGQARRRLATLSGPEAQARP